MAKRSQYEVRVYRRYDEEYVDLEIEATSEEEAKELAEKDAVANKSLYFGETPEPSFDAQDAEVIEE
jgi:hypothetical protein